LEPFSRKWSPAILFALEKRPQTFTDLKRESVNGISNKVLSDTVQELRDAGLVAGREDADGYRLTEKGEQVVSVLKTLAHVEREAAEQ
jgi:DNA-binding HxlR family transcriptional regulator